MPTTVIKSGGILNVGSGARMDAVQGVATLPVSGYEYTTDNYEITQPGVTQTDEAIVSLVQMGYGIPCWW